MCRRWTAAETVHLRLHAGEGADAIAADLGRTPGAVRSKAQELGVSLARVRWAGDGDICPRCGRHRVEKGAAGYREGICAPCHYEILADKAEMRSAEESAVKSYNRARDKLRTVRKDASGD